LSDDSDRTMRSANIRFAVPLPGTRTGHDVLNNLIRRILNELLNPLIL
jgi:hypothetical protein